MKKMDKKIILEKDFFRKPRGEMKEYIRHYVYYENGDMDTYFIYSLFPLYNIDGIPLFNMFGQKIYNDQMGIENFAKFDKN